MLEILQSLEMRLESTANNDNILRETRSNIAKTHSILGKHQESLQIYRNVEKEELLLFGQHHPSLLATQHNIALELSHLENHEELLLVREGYVIISYCEYSRTVCVYK